MKKILVVDDEKEIRDLIKERLAQNKYAVMTASSGEEALIICKRSLPDLILLDIAMPEMDGYSTCEKLKQDKKTKNIPVLFLTGKDLEPEGIIERCRNLDACGYISKLSTLKELLEKIEKIIGLAIILFFLFLWWGAKNICFAQTPPIGQIQRSQEILEQEKALREKLEQEEKIFIEKITIKGVTLLSAEQIKEIILPFKRQWLTKRDIEQLLEFIKQAYKEKGYSEKLLNLSYEIKKNRYLEIKVEELMR